MRKLAVYLSLVLLASLMVGGCGALGGFGGTYVNKSSTSIGPMTGPHGKTETIRIRFHRNGRFDAYDDLTGTWTKKGDIVTLKMDNGRMPGMTYPAKIAGNKLIFQAGAPNFVTPFGITFTKVGLF
jgi:hypothetical protein